MDDVDELDLDDEIFSTAPPVSNITRALKRNAPCIGEPRVAMNTLSAAMGTVTQTQAASKEGNTSNRAPLKPLASLLHIPTFPRSPKGSNPPAQPLTSRPAQREDSSKGRTQSRVLRANKRPAEEHSNLLSKRLVSGPGQGLSTVWNAQASLGRPAMHAMLAEARSGFRPPSAPSIQDPQHVGQRPASQQEAQSFQAPFSPAVSTQQGLGSSSFIIPGPAGVQQQRSGQQLPSLNPTSSHSSHPQSFASLHDDFAVSAAWQSAMRVAIVNSIAGTAPQQRDSLQTVMQSQKRAGKVNRLVVMLKSLSLTGCGDAFAVVKDPATASMGAGIDQEVLQSYPCLDPGAVLVLDNVSYLFMATVPYLCVTMANVRMVVPPETPSCAQCGQTGDSSVY